MDNPYVKVCKSLHEIPGKRALRTLSNTVPWKETRLFTIFFYKVAIFGTLKMTLNLHKKEPFYQKNLKII